MLFFFAVYGDFVTKQC